MINEMLFYTLVTIEEIGELLERFETSQTQSESQLQREIKIEADNSNQLQKNDNSNDKMNGNQIGSNGENSQVGDQLKDRETNSKSPLFGGNSNSVKPNKAYFQPDVLNTNCAPEKITPSWLVALRKVLLALAIVGCYTAYRKWQGQPLIPYVMMPFFKNWRAAV